jgi:hypothetical protein
VNNVQPVNPVYPKYLFGQYDNRGECTASYQGGTGLYPDANGTMVFDYTPWMVQADFTQRAPSVFPPCTHHPQPASFRITRS